MTTKFPKELFNIREAKGENHYYIMIVNEALRDYQFKSQFPWFLHFDIIMKEVSKPFNLPTKKEAGIFNSLEDRIKSVIKQILPYQFIGRTTENGHRELYFYVESPNKIHEELNNFIQHGNLGRELEYSMVKDVNWEQVEFFFNY